ncbi:MAG: transposase, partial [Duncaniella dubosii]|nr:transposase [Duncaniella dubosii]
MAIFKAIVRTKRKDGFYQVYIRCVHNRKPGYIKTDKLVTDKQLDRNGEIKDPFVNEYCARRILEFTQRLNRKEIGKWTVKQVVDFLAMEDEDLCFSDYARLHID